MMEKLIIGMNRQKHGQKFNLFHVLGGNHENLRVCNQQVLENWENTSNVL